VDPALVAAHEAQGVQVADHAGHHAWDARHGLQKQNARQPLVLGHVRPVPSHEVVSAPDCLYVVERDTIQHLRAQAAISVCDAAQWCTRCLPGEATLCASSMWQV